MQLEAKTPLRQNQRFSAQEHSSCAENSLFVHKVQPQRQLCAQNTLFVHKNLTQAYTTKKRNRFRFLFPAIG
jgi:hypothetical protein